MCNNLITHKVVGTLYLEVVNFFPSKFFNFNNFFPTVCCSNFVSWLYIVYFSPFDIFGIFWYSEPIKELRRNQSSTSTGGNFPRERQLFFKTGAEGEGFIPSLKSRIQARDSTFFDGILYFLGAIFTFPDY